MPSSCRIEVSIKVSNAPCRTETHQNTSSERIVEPFNELDGGTLAAARSADEGNVGTGFNDQVEVAEDTDARTGGVSEVNVFEADVALDSLGIDLDAIGGPRVDFGNLVDEVDDVVGSTLGG